MLAFLNCSLLSPNLFLLFINYLSTTSNPIHSFGSDATLHCSLSYHPPCHANTNIDGVVEHIFWDSNNQCFQPALSLSLRRHSFSSHISFDWSFLSSSYWSAYSLGLHCAGLPSYLGLLLALRAKLGSCFVPGFSSPLSTFFHCRKLRSARHLNNSLAYEVRLRLRRLRFSTGLNTAIRLIDDLALTSAL